MNKIIFIFLCLFTTVIQAEEFGRLFKNANAAVDIKPANKTIKPQVGRNYNFQGILLINQRPAKIWLAGGGKYVGKTAAAYNFNLHGKNVLLKPAQYYQHGKVLEYWQIK